ncbi:hypothetical protein QUV58_09325, partial [Succinatimonas hippei]|uniref:hypothetical protein n=2 Tax=Succinatimonas hippei TaxID=626938 RepID=UPI0025A4A279
WLLLIKVIKIFLHHYFKFGKVIFMHIIFGITHLFKEQFAGKDGLSFQILENHSVNRTLVGSELTINNVVRLAMEKKIAEKDSSGYYVVPGKMDKIGYVLIAFFVVQCVILTVI